MAVSCSRSALSVSKSIRMAYCSLALSARFFLPHELSHHRAHSSILAATRLRQSPPMSCLYHIFRSNLSSSTNTNNPTCFNWSDDDDDNGGEHDGFGRKTKTEAANASKPLTPPYDPFSKKPLIEEPKDPSNLQEIFHKMRTDGLTNNAIKMFDALSKDGLTHEALELFAVIKDKGTMPDVVAHTAVIEAYVNAGGHSKDAIRTFDRMLSSGVAPNAYTYAVLIKGLARDSKLPEAQKYLFQMMKEGLRPNAPTYLAVFEGYLRDQRFDDARQLLDEMRHKGFRPDEKAVREYLGKRGKIFRDMLNLLFGK